MACVGVIFGRKKQQELVLFMGHLPFFNGVQKSIQTDSFLVVIILVCSPKVIFLGFHCCKPIAVKLRDLAECSLSWVGDKAVASVFGGLILLVHFINWVKRI